MSCFLTKLGPLIIAEEWSLSLTFAIAFDRFFLISFPIHYNKLHPRSYFYKILTLTLIDVLVYPVGLYAGLDQVLLCAFHCSIQHLKKGFFHPTSPYDLLSSNWEFNFRTTWCQCV